MRPEEFRGKSQEELEKIASETNYGAIYELANRYKKMDITPSEEELNRYREMNILTDSQDGILHRKLYERVEAICKEINDNDSNCYLGMLYYNNNMKDYSKEKSNYQIAKEYFDKCAEEGNILAKEYLGKMYYFGVGVEKDYDKAKEYFEICEKENPLYGSYFLGLMYYYGEGVELDYEKARQYFEIAKKDETSNYFLGCMYYYGEGVEKDYFKAQEYFEKECKFKDAESIYYLGEIYLNGLTGNKDEKKAENEYFSKIEKYYLLSIIYYCLGLTITEYDKIMNLISSTRQELEDLMDTIPVDHPAPRIYNKIYYLSDNQYNYIKQKVEKKVSDFKEFSIKDKFTSEEEVEKYVENVLNCEN